MFDDLRDELEKKVEQLKRYWQHSKFDRYNQTTICKCNTSYSKAKDDSINSINTNKADALNNIEEQTTLSLAQIDSKRMMYKVVLKSLKLRFKIQ